MKPKPIKIGITGGIGSGKSVVSHLLQIMGVPVYISDDEAKRLTATDPAIRAGLVGLLGQDVYQNGMLNKRLLADYLFSDAAHVSQVNAIIHPRVRTDFESWATRQGNAQIVGIESAILFEAGFENTVDYSLMVYAPRELRLRRAMQRDDAGREEVERRINRQMDDEQKRSKCCFTVVNDGRTPLIPQILALLGQLT